MKYVAIVGNLSEGFTVVGPYADLDAAARAHPGWGEWIMPVQSAEEWRKAHGSNALALGRSPRVP